MRRGGGRAAAEGAPGSRVFASIAGREVARTAAAERGLGRVGWLFPRKLSQRPRRRDPQSAGQMARMVGRGGRRWQLLGWAGESCSLWLPEASEKSCSIGPRWGVGAQPSKSRRFPEGHGQPQTSSPGVKGRGSGKWHLRDPGGKGSPEMGMR